MTSDVAATGVRAEAGGPVLAAEFAVFYREHHRRCVRYCYRLVGEEQAAFDLAQEAFARLFTRWVRLRDPAAYLFHVATNLARADFRRRARDAMSVPVPLVPAAEGHVHLRIAVDRLPRRYRELVLLYYFADLPVAAVAAAVRRPNGTVMRQLAEARALLAIDLEDADDVR